MTIDTPISGSCKASSTLPDTVLFCADSVETLPVSNSNSKKTYELKTFINKYLVKH